MKRLGRYELLQRIGSGGMAQVWMGRLAATQGVTKAVAIKVPTGDVVEDHKQREAFLKEARLSMLLSHSNVVQVFDVGEQEGQPFLVMEWVDGMNLAQLARNLVATGRTMPAPVAAYVVGEVLRALDYAHAVTHEGAQLGVVHRDVSPHNVLVSVSGEVKLTDFGVARLAREDTSGLHVKGKLSYMAPEQLAGNSRGGTVDLYAVGAMLHELLDGSRFRDARDEAHMYGLVMSGEIPPLRAEGVPRELDELRLGLLQPNPVRRIPSAQRALELLMRWPAYRNCSIELGRMCRSLTGVVAPRSGIHTAHGVTDDDLGTAPTETLTSPSGGEGVAAPTRTTPVASASPEHGSRSRSARVAPLLAAVGLLALAVGTVAFLQPFGAEEVPPVEAVVAGREPGAGSSTSPSTSPVAAGVEPKPKPAPEGRVEAEPSRDPGASGAMVPAGPPGEASLSEPGSPPPSRTLGTEPTPAEEAEAPVPAKVAPKVRAKPKVGPPAQVTFKLGDFDYAEVKVRGKVLQLQPKATVSLPPGRHAVKIRASPSESWRSTESIALESGTTYDVRLKKPGELRLQRTP